MFEERKKDGMGSIVLYYFLGKLYGNKYIFYHLSDIVILAIKLIF